MSDIGIHIEEGNRLGKAGELDHAFEHFQTAMTHDPDCADAYFGMAAIWYKRNDMFRAEQCLTHVLKISPGHDTALKLLAKCRKTMEFENGDAPEYTVLEKRNRNPKKSAAWIVAFGIVLPLMLACVLGYMLFMNL